MVRTRHLLICRTDNLGDVVLTLPLAGYLKQRYPTLKIGFLCRGYAAPLVRHCSAIDYVLELEHSDVAPALHDRGIDTIIFSKPDRRLAAAAKKARIAQRIGTSHRWFHWLYCNRLVHFSRVNSPLHEAQLNFKLLQPLGIDFVPALEDIPALYRLQAPFDTGQIVLPKGHFHLIFHPKSNGNGREWPIAHYLALAKRLQSEARIKIWMTGSEQEGQWLTQHAMELLQLPHVTNVCGQFSVDQLAGFIHAAQGLIASGTGPLHIAAALGKPTLGLFPPLKPIHPGRWAPLGWQAQVLCAKQACRDCQNGGLCHCMNSVTPTQVANVVQQWLLTTSL